MITSRKPSFSTILGATWALPKCTQAEGLHQSSRDCVSTQALRERDQEADDAHPRLLKRVAEVLQIWLANQEHHSVKIKIYSTKRQ